MTMEQQVTVRESDVSPGGGRVLHAYDTGPAQAGAAGAPDARLPVFWLHGTPMIGAPPTPLFAAAAEHGVRWVSYDRPGYGKSSPVPGRDVASAATDVAVIADALGFDRFAVLGQSGGGPYALACAALLPHRVIGAVSMSGRAPYPADGLDWLAGMRPGSAAELNATLAGRDALAALLASAEDDFDPEMFTPADHAALAGDWKWISTVVDPALEQGTEGLIDDALASVRPWGFDLAAITAPVLLVHGIADRVMPSAHSEWLARRIGSAELVLIKDAGHISAFQRAPEALAWLAKLGSQASDDPL